MARKRKNFKNQVLIEILKQVFKNLFFLFKSGACIVDSQNKIVGYGNYTQSSKNSIFSYFRDNKTPNTDYGSFIFLYID